MICGLEFGGMPGCLHKFRLYAAGSGMLLFECRVSGIGNAKGCSIGSIVMLRGCSIGSTGMPRVAGGSIGIPGDLA